MTDIKIDGFTTGAARMTYGDDTVASGGFQIAGGGVVSFGETISTFDTSGVPKITFIPHFKIGALFEANTMPATSQGKPSALVPSQINPPDFPGFQSTARASDTITGGHQTDQIKFYGEYFAMLNLAYVPHPWLDLGGRIYLGESYKNTSSDVDAQADRACLVPGDIYCTSGPQTTKSITKVSNDPKLFFRFGGYASAQFPFPNDIGKFGMTAEFLGTPTNPKAKNNKNLDFLSRFSIKPVFNLYKITPSITLQLFIQTRIAILQTLKPIGPDDISQARWTFDGLLGLGVAFDGLYSTNPVITPPSPEPLPIPVQQPVPAPPLAQQPGPVPPASLPASLAPFAPGGTPTSQPPAAPPKPEPAPPSVALQAEPPAKAPEKQSIGLGLTANRFSVGKPIEQFTFDLSEHESILGGQIHKLTIKNGTELIAATEIRVDAAKKVTIQIKNNIKLTAGLYVVELEVDGPKENQKTKISGMFTVEASAGAPSLTGN